MSITDALSRISQIQQELAQLSGGTAAATSSTPATTDGSSTAAAGTSGTSGTSFADALAQAQSTGASDASGAGDTTGLSGTGDATGTTGATSGGTGVDAASSAIENGDAEFANTLLGSSSTGTDGTLPSDSALVDSAALSSGGVAASDGATTAATTSTGAALPGAAGSLLNSSQQQFASTLAADTGLNPGVVSAWVLAEESGGAAQSRQAQNNNDWLNVGYTGSGDYGTSDSIWSDPVTAANATAGWLKGQDTISGYGAAGAGVQSILQTVGQTPQAQIAAVQSSGWASSGYPTLPGLYDEVTS